jgi:hypothetical protein
MLMVCYFTVLLRVEVRQEEEFAYARGCLLIFGIWEVSTPQSASLGCRLVANAKAVEHQFFSDLWTRLGRAIFCRDNFTRKQ